MAKWKLDEFPNVGVSWCHAPETVENYPDCDVDGCQCMPEYEIYFDDGEFYWYYMCVWHKDYFARRSIDV